MSEEISHAIGKAFEKKGAFSQSLPWYLRSYELSNTDEALGMALGVCLAVRDYELVRKLLNNRTVAYEGYYYTAGCYELLFRTNAGVNKEIPALERFLGIQEEESYMLRLATLYLQTDQQRKAIRLCRKLIRLFAGGQAVDYAEKLQDAVKNGSGIDFVIQNPWYEDKVFKHLSFDLGAPVIKDHTIIISSNDGIAHVEEKETLDPVRKDQNSLKKENDSSLVNSRFGKAVTSFFSKTSEKRSEKKQEKSKAKKREKIAPLVEKCMSDVIGMHELKTSMNSLYNMMQINKKRVGGAVLKNNIRILGPEGCGKTTAARVAAKVLYNIGIIGNEEPVVTDYFSLVGSTSDETHENIQHLFEKAENSCILIENIHEFDDSDTYSNGLLALDMIVRAYGAAEERIPLIITGSADEVELLFANKKRFGDLFNLPSILLGKYSTEELVQIAHKIADAKNYILDDNVDELLSKKIDYMTQMSDFKYSHDLEGIIYDAIIKQISRISSVRRISENDCYLLKVDDFDTDEKSETVEELLEQLDGLTGLHEVKKQVHTIVNLVEVQKMREESGIGGAEGYGSLHLAFLGNAGTGKTTVARLIGKIYKKLGVLPGGQLVECTRKDLVSEYRGGTAQKVDAKVKEAMGGILFIDEAYTLCQGNEDTFGLEAINTLLADIENYRDNLMVILAGYSYEMERFMDNNQGLRSRIPTDILFEDYSTEEMVQIFKQNIKNSGLILDAGLDDAIYAMIENQKKRKDFGNARGVRNITEKVISNQGTRIAQMDSATRSRNDFLIIRRDDLEAGEEKTTKSVEEYLTALNSLTGLNSVKEKVNKTVAMVRVNQEMRRQGLSAQGFGTLHLVFKGNAGTGKTTVARLLGGIYKELGVLSSGHLVETDRSGLVAGYSGQTAQKVKDVIQKAMGGILFIDEAYTLAQGGENDFGKEAIDTLVADIENNRNDLMVIIAGYSDDMDHFLSQNQGLKSRFPNEIIFEDYTSDELVTIFKNDVQRRGGYLIDGTEELIVRLIEEYAGTNDFGNARGVRNLVDKVFEQRSMRIADILNEGRTPSQEELQRVLPEDIEPLLYKEQN
ncbi:MAG: AAA family ATPase [Eubacterium sp.]|nr:AAA family ATPase [Eubacterium sp.]